MFQPVIPLSGIGGWNFLQSTYDRQLKSFADSAQVRNDRDYMTSALSKPMAVEDFLKDSRLLRTTLTAFDLGGEEWKRGFISKVLTEAADPESTFLARLNNPQYTRFAEAFRPVDGKIAFNTDKIAEIGARFEAASFEEAVGEVDNDLRLSLNYQTEIVDIAGSGSSEETILYKLLGSVPVRTVLEGATGLPADIRKLPIEQQAGILKDKLQSQFGISNLAEMTDLDKIDKVIHRFNAVQSLSGGISQSAPGSTALTLLTGVGGQASQNLFLSLLL